MESSGATLVNAPVRLTTQSPRSLFLAIAKLHSDSIHHGALPHLGIYFMSRMYFEFTRAPQSGVWVILENDQPLAFLAGCARVNSCLRSVLLKGGIALGLRALAALRFAVVWRKLPAVLLYPFRQRNRSEELKNSGDSAELLSMAVAENTRGKGAGTALVQAFEKALIEWQVKGYRVTTNIQEAGSNAFYKRMGFTPSGTMQHHELVLQQYWKALPESETKSTKR